jgi:uncharacterized C2H2 Zn-finger protein
MANWLLDCPECKKHFVHSEVVFSEVLPDRWVNVLKPEFPDGGATLECPNCKAVSVYKRHQLKYSAT